MRTYPARVRIGAVNTVARLSPLLLVTMSAFQAALAAGAPWGRASYSGKHSGTLPGRLRVASAAASLTYAAGAATLASHRTHPRVRRAIGRGCVAIGILGTAANALSPSRPERMWSAWSFALAVSAWQDLAAASEKPDRT